MCSCLPSLKLPCLKIGDLKTTGWPRHRRVFGCIPGIELLAGSSFFPAKVKCSQKKEMIDYLVWKKRLACLIFTSRFSFARQRLCSQQRVVTRKERASGSWQTAIEE